MNAVQDPDSRRSPSAYTRLLAINEQTGLVEGVIVQEQELKKARGAATKKYPEPFLTVFLAAALELARRKDLTESDHRVLWALIARSATQGDVIDSDPLGLSEQLEMHPRQLARAMAHLAEMGLVLRPKRGKIAVHPRIAWKGTPEERAKALRATVREA